ncbi:MAG: 2-amino-3,7-dideoxy-D-threo-hept-6-ulosonate synthase [Halobacteria archaeon]
MIGKKLRLEKIRDQESGNFLTVPMDHGVTIGPVKGLENIGRTINEIKEGGGDSILVQKGVVKHQVEHIPSDMGVAVHINAATTVSPDPNNKVVVGSVEEAVRHGADAVSAHINVGSETEAHQFQDLGEIADDCDRFGMPLIAMMYVRGPDVDSNDEETLAHAARLGGELGADVIKTNYTGNPEKYRQVIEGSHVPVIIAGGPKAETPLEVLEDIKEAIDVGARGVAIGRNIFQHDDVASMTRAVSEIVHKGKTVDESVEKAELEL